MLDAKAQLPTAVLYADVVLASKTLRPTATLLLAVVLATNALKPIATLKAQTSSEKFGDRQNSPQI